MTTTDATDPETTEPAGTEPVADPRGARLATWEARTTPAIIVAALLPIVVAFTPTPQSALSDTVNVVCWLVFLVDLAVHMRLRPHYLRTGRGRFDLVIVLITAPWFLITGGASQFVVIARLARLGRVITASARSNKLKHLGNQLGSAAAYAGGLILACSILVKALNPTEFPTYGDAIWWGFVTFTTVGYGDFYPTTAAARVVAIVLMLGGVAFLGTLAGTLSAFFGVGADGKEPEYDDEGNIIVPDDDDGTVDVDDADTAAAKDAAHADTAALAAEVAALRETVHALVKKLDERGPAA
ncbi:MAG TPA: ion transporter [Candidatus Nanopelagicales bacterium]|nr:ion transporter [Candidatus Nanopelagicales bacterium]